MNDPEIRLALKEYLFHCHNNGLIVDELGMLNGEARIDIAVICEKLIGYEIKSERDSLDRLATQANAYNQVFDEITLVVAKKHLLTARKMVPKHWGIIQATRTCGKQSITLKPMRKAKANSKQNLDALARLLWRNEALQALENAGLDKGYRSKPRKEIFTWLAQNFSTSELKPLIYDALSSRTNWRIF